MRWFLIKHDGKLDNCPFRGPLYIKKKAPREQLLHKNHKHVSQPKDFNKSTDTSNNKGPNQATIACPRPKVNSVCFEYLYDHINRMDNTHEDTHLIDTQEQDTEDTEVEQE